MKKVSKKKMITGGMSNPNKVSVQTTPGSNGVKPNVNPKVTASPSKMGYGGKMSKGGATKSKMGYGGMKKKAC